MLLLALDTSTNQSSVALCSEDLVYGEQTWYSANNHSVELLCNIQRLLEACNMTMQQLDALAVATGPGSFNGVRVALAAAKSFAFVLHKPLVGISTLECVASGQQMWRGPVCALLEAGRSELYAACYRFKEVQDESGTLFFIAEQLGDYLLLAPQQLVTYLQEQAGIWPTAVGERYLPPLLFCGEISEASHRVLRSQLQERCFFADGISSTRRASVVAMLAFQRLHAGKVQDPLALEPLYLRRPSITKSTRKQPLLGGTTPQSTGNSTTEREEGALRH
ncbi:MAG: tRNA (adenosine(37)-N6)-threonylcarbamoyltransferase complex dimerization subunit type 1 TsaB [Ktedonobacteraceae bacterium]|nr:tRNA (adenosine(37)-N6)-threonylcarbamoyltransferase complex dimerization subunit type 1 TsaB [Ktedonobacteraceae bacterium]